MTEIEYSKIEEIVESGHQKTVDYLKSEDFCQQITGVKRDVHIADHKTIKVRSDFINGIWKTITYVFVAAITSGLIGIVWAAVRHAK